MNIIYYYIYLIITFFIVLYLTLKSNPAHKYITFIIAYWILAGPVLNTEYFIIDIKGLPFDLQPPRIIFILFTIYLILVWAGKVKNVRVNTKEPKFERYLFLYIFLSIVVNVIHTIDILRTKDTIVNSTKILTFLVIYLVIKRTADERIIKTLFKALIIACIFSSLIGIYQFLVNPLFFRLGSERVAFAGLMRSNGIYHAEYFQSYFLIPGIILTLFTVRSKLLKYTLIGILLIGIIFTFHRTSWIITILLFTLYFIEVKKKKVWQMVTFAVLTGAVLLSFSSMFIPNLAEVKSSPFVQDRLFDDTTIGRFALYSMAINELPEFWLFGVGSTKSDVYYKGVLSAGGSKKVASGEAGGIHNLYIGMAYFSGLPVIIIFILFLVMVFSYFWRLSKTVSIFFLIILFDVIKYIVSNMTNGFVLSGDLGLLLAIFLGIGVAVYQKNINVNFLIKSRMVD